MIPILYNESEMTFSGMGICSLSDCQKATVKRVLNGKDELELVYPVDGAYFDEIKNSRQILVQPEYKKSVQAYRIYQVTKPMNGLVTVNARHISERRNYIMVKPFTAGSVTQAISRIATNLVGTSPFTFYTDKNTTASYKRTEPSSLGSVLGGSEGSFLDVYGGEYEFDMYQVKLLNRRGIDRGVEISYGKNLQKLEVLEAVDDTVITGVCPVWTGEGEDPVYLPEYVLSSQSAANYPYNRVIVLDLSDQFEQKPTVEQLRTAGNAYLAQGGIGEPKLSLKINFVHLAEFPEYASLGVLETLNLGDTVHVHHLDLGVDVSARIVELAYDVINERYASIIVGKVKSNMSSTLRGITEGTERQIRETRTRMQEAIEHATDLLSGASGGYFVTPTDEDGHPTEALFMDTDDMGTATNVLRINKNGIGFSTTGVNGPFTSAWTIDGHFVADFITAGTLNANVIRAGLIEDTQHNNSWNLDTGEFITASGQIGRFNITSTNLHAYGTAGDSSTCVGMGGNQAFWAGAAQSNNAPFRVSYSGELYATGANITGSFTMTGGSIDIATDSSTQDKIKLSYTSPLNGQIWKNHITASYVWLHDSGDDVECFHNAYGLQGPAYSTPTTWQNTVKVDGNYVGMSLHNTSGNRGIYDEKQIVLSKWASSAYSERFKVSADDATLKLTNGTQYVSIAASAGGAFGMYNGTNKYSALLWPDSNGAGRLVLGDGNSTKWRTELTNDGLVFRNSSDTVIASFNANRADNLVTKTGSSVSLQSATSGMTNLTSFTLTRGLWIVSCVARFANNATGYRYALIATSATGGTQINDTAAILVPPADGNTTRVPLVTAINVTAASATYYLNARQNSGSALTSYGYVIAVKVA